MSGLFISYRREDCQGWAGRLADAVKANFDETLFFLDIESIKPGDDFAEAIKTSIGSCNLLLALIGPHWLSAVDRYRKRRLDDPNDFVRLEIATAIARKIRVIPILLGGATMPRPDDLPPELIPLARRQAHEISDIRWDFDCEELMRVLEVAFRKPRKIKSVSSIKDRADISVAKKLVVTEKSSIGNIKGFVGAVPTDKSIEVANKAEISEGSKAGDIIGIDFSGNTRDTNP